MKNQVRSWVFIFSFVLLAIWAPVNNDRKSPAPVWEDRLDRARASRLDEEASRGLPERGPGQREKWNPFSIPHPGIQFRLMAGDGGIIQAGRLTLFFEDESEIFSISNDRGIVQFSDVVSEERIRVVLIECEGFPRALVRTPRSISAREQPYEVRLERGFPFKIYLINQGGQVVSRGNLALNALDQDQVGGSALQKSVEVFGGEVLSQQPTGGGLNPGGVAIFRGILPGKYEVGYSHKPFWEPLEHPILEIPWSGTSLVLEVHEWDQSEYASGRVEWNHGPPFWKSHVHFTPHGKKVGQVWAYGESAEFVLKLAYPETEFFDLWWKERVLVSKIPIQGGWHGLVVEVLESISWK
ncbi:MAG: hypothetical protein DWQ01_03180 [Planctomycetota bacterium]|nr:MAG: hypothetical protein DWQ01_03180 [Planctomycetota bacterium]